MENLNAFQRAKRDVRGLLGRLTYKGLINNVPFLMYVAFLGMLYITNSNRAVQTQQELNQEAVLLKELRWRHMDAQTRLTNAGNEQDVMRRAQPLALQPLLLPPYAIKIAGNEQGAASNE